MSAIRKSYIAKLVGRCAALLFCAALWLADSPQLEPVTGGSFWGKPTLLHLLWAIWMSGMVLQLIPAKAGIALGSKKPFARYFRPGKTRQPDEALRAYIRRESRKAYHIFAVWALLIAVLGVLHGVGLLGDAELFMISVFFYVCDLICVLVWCPFRVYMGNRCCTVCRIFNWDHAMMFTPLLFVDGFYARSLVVMAFVVFVAWEMTVVLHPERFWEKTNASLGCANCTDVLCGRRL